MNGYWIQTHSGIKFDLKSPTLEMIDINDIAVQLAFNNRFAGATGRIYSVAQHSCLVCGLAPKELKLEALLHDAAEAYYHDITTGLKKLFRAYAHRRKSTYDKIVDRFEIICAEKFRLDISDNNKAIIKEIDSRICLTEKKSFLKKSFSWDLEEKYSAYDFNILPEMTSETINKFLELFNLYKRNY